MELLRRAYTCSYAALGEMAAWMTGWILILEYGLANVAVASAFSGDTPVSSRWDGPDM
jgi:amino acid transporter